MQRYFTLFSIFIVSSQCNLLFGKNVCVHNETYTVSIEKHVKRNATIREYVWCLSVPPRCSKYRIIEKDAIEIVNEEKYRFINKCCNGFKEINKQCFPICEKCENGTCISPEKCICFAGFTGNFCNESYEETIVTKEPLKITTTTPTIKKLSKTTNSTSTANIIEISKKNSNSTGKMPQFSAENITMKRHFNQNKNFLVFSVCSSFLVLIIIVLTVFMFIMVKKYKTQRDFAIKKVLNVKKDVKIEHIKQSVFHAPLPDLPDAQKHSSLREIQDNENNLQNIKFKVTGETQTKTHYDILPLRCLEAIPSTAEPIYDEIPAHRCISATINHKCQSCSFKNY